jgi:predicted transcriptional regulator
VELMLSIDNVFEELANRIEEKAVAIVDREGLVAWGKLRRAVTTKYHANTKTIDVFVESQIAPYALYVHEGREPGKMPPVSIIEEWARKKRLLSSVSRGVKLSARINPSAKLSAKQQQLADRYHSLAWAIATKIKTKGIKPRRFLIQAILETLKDFNN